tara:strand:- start:1738 stop:2022 length:285 start_codon:yes stop_codon:yes gene_type:complete
MASFDRVVTDSTNFKGYTGNPPTTEAEYDALDCWTDKSSAPSWDSVSTDMASEEVRFNRKAEYPALAEQLDEIYHNGVDSWKAVIKVIKDKFPK